MENQSYTNVFAWNAGRLIRFCRPFMPGVEKHTDSLTEIAVKTHFASQGFIDSGYITCRIFITLPFQYAYGFIQDFTNFPACTFMRRTVSMVYAPLKSTRPLKESNSQGVMLYPV